MPLGKRNPDNPPANAFEVARNEPARKRDAKAKERANNPKPFYRKQDPNYTYAFGGKWKTKHPGAIEKHG